MMASCRTAVRMQVWLPTALVLVGWCGVARTAAQATDSTVDSTEIEADPIELRQTIILVVGAPGTDEYGEMFADWAAKWEDAAHAAEADLAVIGLESTDEADRLLLERTIADRSAADFELLWIVLIGHGTYDGQSAKFNLRGPDLTAAELAEWLAPIQSPTVVINCASSSAPFLNRLSGENRVVVTATRSGDELNFARFGHYLADAINDSAADLDKDEQVSLLEAFLTASRQVQEFYDQEARLATEHALLDDNGDGLGTTATWFRGLRATKRAKEGGSLDGLRAHQTHLVASDREAQMPRELRQQRDLLEQQIEQLRGEKSKLGEDEYYAQLEALMVRLARLYLAPAKDETMDGLEPIDTANSPER